MYHPTRGGVRGGRDQFKWDDVKVDKHRENYLGHSIMAPVGRWQKGKDLHWYARDKKAAALDAEKAKEEVKRIKEEEEQAMREALGLAPKRASRAQGNKLDKYEYAELTKRGSTAEDLGGGHAEAAQVQGLGLYKGHKTWAQTVSAPNEMTEEHPAPEKKVPEGPSPPGIPEEASEDDDTKKKRRREERKEEKERRQSKQEKRSHDSEDRHSKHEKKRSRDSQDKHKHRREKERRRHDSDSD